MTVEYPTTERAALRAEIEATRDAFRSLVASLPENRWREVATGSKWNGRQLLEHITWSLEQLPKEIESARNERGMFNYPKVLANAGSLWMVKWSARKATRESLSARYDAAIEKILGSLKAVQENEWTRGARFYGEGFYSVADLFRTPANHFQEHASLLRDPPQ
jgi:hypothetical protein